MQFLPGQQFQLTLHLCRHSFGQGTAVGDENRRSQFVVFGLGQQIGGQMGGVVGAVGHHENLTGSGNHVNGHLSKHLPFRFGHIGVAGANDFIDPGYRFGAVGHGRHGLGAAQLENPVHTGDFRRRQNAGFSWPPLAGVTIMHSGTPAILAGMAFISTDEG